MTHCGCIPIERRYYYDLVGSTTVRRNPHRYQLVRQPGEWRLVESALVVDPWGSRVWFEVIKARYTYAEMSHRLIESLVRYLNESQSLRHRLDQRYQKSGAISLCHKRRILSFDFMINPNAGFPAVKDEVIQHQFLRPPFSQHLLIKTVGSMNNDVSRANWNQDLITQRAYYEQLLAGLSDNQDIEHIERLIQSTYLNETQPQGHSVSAAERSSRTQRALRGIRII